MGGRVQEERRLFFCSLSVASIIKSTTGLRFQPPSPLPVPNHYIPLTENFKNCLMSPLLCFKLTLYGLSKLLVPKFFLFYFPSYKALAAFFSFMYLSASLWSFVTTPLSNNRWLTLLKYLVQNFSFPEYPIIRWESQSSFETSIDSKVLVYLHFLPTHLDYITDTYFHFHVTHFLPCHNTSLTSQLFWVLHVWHVPSICLHICCSSILSSSLS